MAPEADDAAQVLALYEQGRRMWPQIEISLASFTAFLAPSLSADGLEPARAADVYLACSCAAGHPLAIAEVEASCIATLDRTLRPLDPSGAMVEETKQALRVKLLVAEPGARPRICDYVGKGDLRTFVRATAIRVALNLIRSQHRELPTSHDVLVGICEHVADPELELLKAECRAEFHAALRQAFSRLSPRQRNLLRHQLLDQLDLEEVGAIYRIHRTTAGRWTAAARTALVAHTKRILRRKLHVGADEVERLIALISSRLELSLSLLHSAR